VTWQMGRKRLLATSNESPIFEEEKKTVWKKKEYINSGLFPEFISVELADATEVV
jgi:hypothetical protein